MFFEILECRLPLGFQVLLADAGDDPRAGAVAAVGRAAVGDEEQHAVRVAVDQAGDRHVRILATGVGHFLRRVPAFLDPRDHLAADRAVGVVAIDQVEKVRRDRHRQFVPGEQDSRAFNIGQIEPRLQVNERVHAVAKLPFMIVPMMHLILLPVSWGMGDEGGVEVGGAHGSLQRSASFG